MDGEKEGKQERSREEGVSVFSSLSFLLTSERWTDAPHLHRACRGELAHDKLEVVERFADEHEHQEVWNEERAAAVVQSHERKPPHVPDAHGHGDARQQKLSLVVPLLPLGSCRLLPW